MSRLRRVGVSDYRRLSSMQHELSLWVGVNHILAVGLDLLLFLATWRGVIEAFDGEVLKGLHLHELPLGFLFLIQLICIALGISLFDVTFHCECLTSLHKRLPRPINKALLIADRRLRYRSYLVVSHLGHSLLEGHKRVFVRLLMLLRQDVADPSFSCI